MYIVCKTRINSNEIHWGVYWGVGWMGEDVYWGWGAWGQMYNISEVSKNHHNHYGGKEL